MKLHPYNSNIIYVLVEASSDYDGGFCFYKITIVNFISGGIIMAIAGLSILCPKYVLPTILIVIWCRQTIALYVGLGSSGVL